jgi:predicted transcriptional regulator
MNWYPVDMVEEKKTSLSLKVRSELKRDIERVAKAERRSPGNLSEVLLEWAFSQLQVAGNSIDLLKENLGTTATGLSFDTGNVNTAVKSAIRQLAKELLHNLKEAQSHVPESAKGKGGLPGKSKTQDHPTGTK